jgi:hypothetical protein
MGYARFRVDSSSAALAPLPPGTAGGSKSETDQKMEQAGESLIFDIRWSLYV